MEYLTVSEGTPSKLDKSVNLKLSEGWLLYGQPFISTNNYSRQTMVKFESGEKISDFIVPPNRLATVE